MCQILTVLQAKHAETSAKNVNQLLSSLQLMWIPVRHSGGPLGLTLTLTPGMADLQNGGPPEWGAGTTNVKVAVTECLSMELVLVVIIAEKSIHWKYIFFVF